MCVLDGTFAEVGVWACESVFQCSKSVRLRYFWFCTGATVPYKGKRMSTAAGWVPDFLCLSSEYWCVLVLLPLLIFVG